MIQARLLHLKGEVYLCYFLTLSSLVLLLADMILETNVDRYNNHLCHRECLLKACTHTDQ